MKVSSNNMYYCYICEFENDDYDYFTTMTIDWNSELVCMGCEEQYHRHSETVDEGELL